MFNESCIKLIIAQMALTGVQSSTIQVYKNAADIISSPEGFTSIQVANANFMDYSSARIHLNRLRKAGVISKTKGVWRSNSPTKIVKDDLLKTIWRINGVGDAFIVA